MQLYDTDYSSWLSQQIENLRKGNLDELDIPHLIEELEGLNRSNERELESYLVVLLIHLLKWEYQPYDRTGSWRGSILNSRNRIAKLFKQQPSLRNRLVEFIPDAYVEAKEVASEEIGIKINLFPETCPYLALDLINKEWLPD